MLEAVFFKLSWPIRDAPVSGLLIQRFLAVALISIGPGFSALSVRSWAGAGDGAHFFQCVCPEFLRRVFRGRGRLVFDWRLWGIDARFLRRAGYMALLVKEGSHCFSEEH